MGKIIRKKIDYTGSIPSSKNLKYDNSNSGLESTNIQDAIDEVNSKTEVTAYSEKVLLGEYTTTGGHKLNFVDYKKIIVMLTAINIYGDSQIFDTDLITSGMINGVYKTLQAGQEETNYYAVASFCFTSGDTIYIPYIYSPQANYTISIYGIK